MVESSSHLLQITVVIIVGIQRRRAQDCVTSVCQQDGAEHLELIILDFAPPDVKPLTTSGTATVHYQQLTDSMTWGESRAYGIAQATTPIVAFIEEHATASAGWLNAIITAFEAHQLDVGSYGVIGGNDNTYIARAGHIAEYGLWIPPASPVSSTFIPWNNIAFCRDFILALSDDTASLLENDIIVADRVRQNNANYQQIDNAVVVHIGHEHLMGLIEAAYYGSLLMANQRVEMGNWGWMRRIIYALAVPFLVPLMKIRRLVQHFRHQPQNLKDLLLAMPVIMITYCVGAFAEAYGYLVTSSRARSRFVELEIIDKRDLQTDV